MIQKTFHFLTCMIKQKGVCFQLVLETVEHTPLMEIHSVLCIKFSEKRCAVESPTQFAFFSNPADIQGPHEWTFSLCGGDVLWSCWPFPHQWALSISTNHYFW